MRNSWKIAKWEIRRNMKSKSFLISLFLTPVIFILFATVPMLFESSGDDADPTKVYIYDEVGIWEQLEPFVNNEGYLNWDAEVTTQDLESIKPQILKEENTAYISLDQESVEQGTISILLGEDTSERIINEAHVLEQPLRQVQLLSAGFSEEDIQLVNSPIVFETVDVEESPADGGATEEDAGEAMTDVFEKAIPGIFAGLVLFSIVISGMMIFQSASQEKKDKVAEIILSSVTTDELMQGKIIGYFVLGIVQVGVWLGFAIPFAIWRFNDVPILEYLLVPQLLLLLLISILGYLLFATIFVGLGATLEDASSSGNFQGFVLMIPFIPFILLSPVFSDPNGMVATIATYVPFTSPAVLIMRLSVLDQWPWVEIIIALAILIVSIWIFAKLAGKIFKVGILIYGKNATPKEIWKWLRA
ncbi:ABC transporter permease [Bacillaceae bacterium W0354]